MGFRRPPRTYNMWVFMGCVLNPLSSPSFPYPLCSLYCSGPPADLPFRLTACDTSAVFNYPHSDDVNNFRTQIWVIYYIRNHPRTFMLHLSPDEHFWCMIILSDPVAMVIDCHGAALVTDGGGHSGWTRTPWHSPPLHHSVLSAFWTGCVVRESF